MCNCNCHNQNDSSRANTTIISSEAGNDGLSAYQIAVNTGLFTGTEQEFVEWNRGPAGVPASPVFSNDNIFDI